MTFSVQRARTIPVFLGMVVLAATVALELGAGGSHAAVSPTMHAFVHEDSSIGLTFDDGTNVGSQARTPPTIPAGTYTIRAADDAFTHDFHLIGPGVDVGTTIGGTETPTWTVTFQSSGTYRFQCDDHPDFMWGEFQTSGTSSGGSSGSSSSGGSSSGSGSSSSLGSSSGTTSNTSGSQTALHTLAGTVSAAGKLTLTLGGKPVAKLKAGRYKIAVSDKSPTQSFVVQEKGHSAITVSGLSFVGTHSVTVKFTGGQWMFYSPAGGAKRSFVVS